MLKLTKFYTKLVREILKRPGKFKKNFRSSKPNIVWSQKCWIFAHIHCSWCFHTAFFIHSYKPWKLFINFAITLSDYMIQLSGQNVKKKFFLNSQANFLTQNFEFHCNCLEFFSVNCNFLILGHFGAHPVERPPILQNLDGLKSLSTKYQQFLFWGVFALTSSITLGTAQISAASALLSSPLLPSSLLCSPLLPSPLLLLHKQQAANVNRFNYQSLGATATVVVVSFLFHFGFPIFKQFFSKSNSIENVPHSDGAGDCFALLHCNHIRHWT